VDKGLDSCLAYNVEDEKEIFLQQPFTIQNLEKDINKLFDKIKELEEKNKNLTDENNNLKKKKEKIKAVVREEEGNEY